MKIKYKKYVKATLVAVVALVGGINVFNTQKSEPLSDMALANVEALADDEIIDGGMLPGFTITCGATEGACWMKSGEMCFVGEATDYACTFYGQEWTSCTSLCN